MTTWLHKLDAKMKRQNMKVGVVPKYVIQQLTQKLKTYYSFTKHHLTLSISKPRTLKYSREAILLCVKSDCALPDIEKNITITNTLTWTFVAWRNLPLLTIKCFSKAGSTSDPGMDEFELLEAEDNGPLLPPATVSY